MLMGWLLCCSWIKRPKRADRSQSSIRDRLLGRVAVARASSLAIRGKRSCHSRRRRRGCWPLLELLVLQQPANEILPWVFERFIHLSLA